MVVGGDEGPSCIWVDLYPCVYTQGKALVWCHAGEVCVRKHPREWIVWRRGGEEETGEIYSKWRNRRGSQVQIVCVHLDHSVCAPCSLCVRLTKRCWTCVHTNNRCLCTHARAHIPILSHTYPHTPYLYIRRQNV